jgi:tetratricopeptide (TPR) repeat protein
MSKPGIFSSLASNFLGDKYNMHCLGCYGSIQESSDRCPACGKNSPLDADSYFKAGMDLITSNVDLAIKLLQDCIQLDPHHQSGIYNLGIALSLDNRYEEAVAYYNELLGISPNYPGIYTAMGQAYFGSYAKHKDIVNRRFTQSTNLLMRAVRQNPEDTDALFSLGNAYLSEGNAEEAIIWLNRALCVSPSSPAIYFVLAKALLSAGQEIPARDMASIAVLIASKDEPYWSELQEFVSTFEDHPRIAPGDSQAICDLDCRNTSLDHSVSQVSIAEGHVEN